MFYYLFGAMLDLVLFSWATMEISMFYSLVLPLFSVTLFVVLHVHKCHYYNSIILFVLYFSILYICYCT